MRRMEAWLASAREEQVADGVICHFCGGPTFAWLTSDETWEKVESLLGQHQACAECFLAAWQVLGLSDGEPFRLVES